MQRVFRSPLEKKGADLRGICPIEDKARQLYLSEVVHRTFLDVNEKGTEAVAVTLAKKKAAMKKVRKMVPFIPEFYADRPFILMIRHRTTDLILFLGRVVDPR